MSKTKGQHPRHLINNQFQSLDRRLEGCTVVTSSSPLVASKAVGDSEKYVGHKISVLFFTGSSAQKVFTSINGK